MAGSLLSVVEGLFALGVDPDSDGGLILGALTPKPPFDDQALTGEADAAPLTLVPTQGGVTVRAAAPADPLVLSLPAGPLEFTIVPPPPAGDSPPRVEVKLLGLAVPAPFLRPAQVTAEGTLEETGGQVHFHLPDLLLVVTATAAPPAAAHLAPATGPGGSREVTMNPPAALVGPGTVVGFAFQSASLSLDPPTGPEITVPELELYVAPPGIAALAMHGGGHDLRLGMSSGDGLGGDFQLTLAGGASAVARPRFLEDLAAHLRLDRGTVTQLELRGRIDLGGEVATRLGPLGDGTDKVSYTLGLTLDSGWRASLALRADGQDAYLWRTQRPDPSTHDLVRDTLGAYAVFTPLLAPNLTAGDGYVDLALNAGAAAGLAASQAVGTQAVTLHGAELVIREPPGGVPEAFVFFDLESELLLDVDVGGMSLLSTREPVKVRHRAIGLRLDFGSDGSSPQLKPVFDPAQGFGLDLADPGMLEVPEPLGEIIQPEGARVARENPLSLDVDLGLKADLGIVTVDRSSVRLPLDPPAVPTLTALGAHIDVPGAVSGGGYLKLEPNGGFEGSLDAALAPPIGIRAAAGLAVRHDQGVDSVLATLDVELPVSIPLGTSGLGLFGFLGLLGVNFERKQTPGQTALDWFVGSANGDATRLDAWAPVATRWALGLGAVIGTVEGGFLFNAKGMVVVELPGPRVLLVMKANILEPRPPTKVAPPSGVLLAVIEISPDSVTIGVVAEYDAKPLLELRVPAEAFFGFHDARNWHLDIGALPPRQPVSVKFLSEVRADGYLMLHGNGIPEFPPHPLQGFSVAAGVHAALTWGPEPIGLYLRISASADLGISFKPMLIIGRLAISGELHLFIISIEASAAAEVLIAEDAFFISAEVCGSVDFFFFSVSGCVKLELGAEPTKLPDPEPLVRALSLHNRSRPVLHGNASDGPVDGSLGDAVPVGVGGELPVVPIDAIPLLQLEMRPMVDPACKFMGGPVPSKLPPGMWLRRGERYYRYTLKSVELSGADAGGVPLPSPVDVGDTPSVWWDRYGKPSGGDDNEVQLALLSWTPDPTPAAAERTTSLDERVSARWGSICVEAAPPAPLMWAFHRAPEGPSPPGWALQSTALPDPPGAERAAPAVTTLRVTEPWRSGSVLGDGLSTLRPAYVFGDAAPPDEEDRGGGHLLVAPLTGTELLPAVPDDERFQQLFEALVPRPDGLLGDALRFDGGGLRTVRILLFVNGRLGERPLVLRPLDSDGNKVGAEVVVDSSIARPVAIDNDLPEEWRDPAGPWRPLVTAAQAAFRRFQRSSPDLLDLALVSTDLPDGTAQIEVGLASDRPVGDASWGVLVFEGTSTAEEVRFGYDSEDRQQQIDVVNGYLGADEGKRAMLRPNATYTVTVTYDVDVTGADDKGNPKDGEAVSFPGKHQSFRFKTDASPPDRLDGWVLATDPGPAEEYVFHGEPLRVVFSTGGTRKLFKAYNPNAELFAVARAASGNHPPPTPAFANAADTEPFAITPFAAALQFVLSDQPCIGGAFVGHQRVTLPIPLEPLTEYILDIQAGQSASPSLYPLFRRRFSTSRYGSFGALAADVMQTPVRHRRVANADPLVTLAAAGGGASPLQVADSQFEQALRTVGWGEPARPPEARVTVIWRDPPSPGEHYAPAAVLLETPEPLWRSRDVPAEVMDSQGTRRFQLQAQPCLKVVETSQGAATRIVRTTDGGRTLVVLAPGLAQSGGTLSLGLRRTHHPLFEGDAATETATLANVDIGVGAPWEVGQ